MFYTRRLGGVDLAKPPAYKLVGGKRGVKLNKAGRPDAKTI